MQVTTVVGCTDLDEMTAFFVDRCGGRLESITPADSPSNVTIRVGDARICLRLAAADRPISLIISGQGIEQAASVTAPNGTFVEFRPHIVGLDVPPSVPSRSIVRAGDDFGVGRAGMHYRDLLPDRWGGRFIASHILIPEGGEVPDTCTSTGSGSS
jgi:hypothetical protein